MAQATVYDPGTGRLEGLYEGSSLELVAAQQAPSGRQLLVLDTPLSMGILERYVITETGVTAKTIATLTASRSPFPPDGIASCTVTMDPFTPCTLVVNGTPYALTDDDPDLVLTSDVQVAFAISLQWHPTHWAAPITVLAQTWIPLMVTSGLLAQAHLEDVWTSRLYSGVMTSEVALWDGLMTVWTSVLYAASVSVVRSQDGFPTMLTRLHLTVSHEACGVQGVPLVRLPVIPLTVTAALPLGTDPPTLTVPALPVFVASVLVSRDAAPVVRPCLMPVLGAVTCQVESLVSVSVPRLPVGVSEQLAVTETPMLA